MILSTSAAASLVTYGTGASGQLVEFAGLRPSQTVLGLLTWRTVVAFSAGVLVAIVLWPVKSFLQNASIPDKQDFLSEIDPEAADKDSSDQYAWIATATRWSGTVMSFVVTPVCVVAVLGITFGEPLLKLVAGGLTLVAGLTAGGILSTASHEIGS